MEENKYYYCHVVGTTDVGCVRKANEDSMGSRETVNGLVSVVCDGMGGHVGGATASRLAVDTILDFLDQMHFDDPREAIGKAIDAANMAVLQRVQMQPELRGMGTTCVIVLVRDGQVYYGHVGDSRIYLVRKHTIKQLTKDQSYVQMLVDMGQISPEEAEHHERKNEITNAIGIEGMQYATVCDTPINPEAGDCFLLCSDGLSGMVSNHEIEKIVSNQVRMRAQERTDALIEKAKQYGGLDNVTAQIVEFSVTPTQKGNTVSKKKIAVFGGIGIAVIAVILLLVFKPWIPEKPTTETPATETPAAETPATETPATETPAAETPAAETPATETPAAEEIGDIIRKEDYSAEVDFKNGGIISTIKFADNSTTVKIGNFDTTIPGRVKLESLSPKDILESENDNVITLSFGDNFVDMVEFSLTTKRNFVTNVHRFKVIVNKTAKATVSSMATHGGKGSKSEPIDIKPIDIKIENTIKFKSNSLACNIELVKIEEEDYYRLDIVDPEKHERNIKKEIKLYGEDIKVEAALNSCVVGKTDNKNNKNGIICYEVSFKENPHENNTITFKASDSKNEYIISVPVDIENESGGGGQGTTEDTTTEDTTTEDTTTEDTNVNDK